MRDNSSREPRTSKVTHPPAQRAKLLDSGELPMCSGRSGRYSPREALNTGEGGGPATSRASGQQSSSERALPSQCRRGRHSSLPRWPAGRATNRRGRGRSSSHCRGPGRARASRWPAPWMAAAVGPPPRLVPRPARRCVGLFSFFFFLVRNAWSMPAAPGKGQASVQEGSEGACSLHLDVGERGGASERRRVGRTTSGPVQRKAKEARGQKRIRSRRPPSGAGESTASASVAGGPPSFSQSATWRKPPHQSNPRATNHRQSARPSTTARTKNSTQTES
jgi:hypothetical protein